MKIFHNAVVYIGDNFTSAFAVEDGRFVAEGDAALALEGERIDLNGAFVCAGFNDSHMHLLNYGQALSMAPLSAHTDSLEEMLDCLCCPGLWSCAGGQLQGHGASGHRSRHPLSRGRRYDKARNRFSPMA